MDPRTNPFAPGAGTRPPELAGRSGIIELCDIALARVLDGKSAQGILMTGLRGVGKTVLLNVIRDVANAKNYQVDLLEAPEGSPLAPRIIPSLRQILLRLSIKAKTNDVVQRALRVLKSFEISANVGDTHLRMKLEPELGMADSGVFDRDLSDLLVSVGEAAKAESTGVALLIDEVQYLDISDLNALIMAVHQVTQRQLPVIVIGAGLPSIPTLSGDAKSYSERLFLYPPIGELTPLDARAALLEPVEKLRVSFEDGALEEIIRITEGYPYFIQEWGSVVWNLSKGPEISCDDVKRAGSEATRRLDESFFRVRLNRVTDAEQRYMRAMAELGKGSYKSGEVAKILGKRANSFGPVRDGLIRKGMIFSSKYGILDFTVPLFDQFIRRAMPEL